MKEIVNKKLILKLKWLDNTTRDLIKEKNVDNSL